MRNILRRAPKSNSVKARIALPRLAAFSSTATESSRSTHTASAALATTFWIIGQREAGTKSMLRVMVSFLRLFLKVSQAGQDLPCVFAQGRDGSHVRRRMLQIV